MADESELILDSMTSDLVPSPVEYAVLAPAGFKDRKDLPLILNLHGGGGSRDNLSMQKPLWDRLWAEKRIPPAVVVMPSVTERGFYMNFKDGSEQWEDFIVGPFIEHLRDRYPVSHDAAKTFLMGASMGGMGSLRMAFRYPDRFGAVAALEPGIEPILKYRDMKEKHRFWRQEDLFYRAYGKPVDAEYWEANHPPSMAIKFADDIRTSGLQIYVEAGDEDQFWLYEGAEFLHRILWREKIRHEYHLVRGADHVGPSLGPRSTEAIEFLFRSLDPWGPPPARFTPVIRWLDRLKSRLDEKDHYSD